MLVSEGWVLCDLGGSGPGAGEEAPMQFQEQRGHPPGWRGAAMPLPAGSGSLERPSPHRT